MANVQGTFYVAETQRRGSTPVSPPNAVDDPVTPLNPPGSNPAHDPVTLATPSNGLTLVGQELGLGLASSGVTGALSGIDWDTFNAKIGGTGTVNRLAKFTASGAIGDSQIFDNGTNVGIGTSNPLSKLELVGTSTGVLTPLQIKNDFGGGNAVAAIKFTNTSSTAANAQNWAWIGSKRDVNLPKGRLVFASSDDIALIPSLSDIGMVLGFNKSLYVGGDGIATNTLDVNGTTRIRTINNLGTSATVVLTKSATGVISERTTSQILGDIGAEPAFTKNTAFNKNFGTTVGTVAEGNDSRILNGQTAFTWGDHALAGYLLASTASSTYVPLTRELTINGVTQDLSVNRTFTVPTHNAVTLGTPNGLSLSGQELSLGLADGSNSGSLSSTDWNTFNNKEESKWTSVGLNIYRNSSVSINQIIDPTATLDINGDLKVRNIDNLGTTPTQILVPSATGLMSFRTLTEFKNDLGAVLLTGAQTITGVKTFNADLNIGDTSLDYVGWDNISKTFGIFSQTQYLHKYRGGASGALNIGQFNVSGDASINNTSNAKLIFGTNNTSRLEIEADGDIIITSVPSGTGDTLMIDAGGRIVKGSGGGGVPNAITITSTATETIDVETNKWNNILLESNAVINIQSIVTSNYFRVILRLKQDGTGGRTVSWNTGGEGIIWENGSSPTLSGNPNWEDLIELFYDGNRINGYHYGSFG